MIGWLRARLAREEGMTLPELMVSITIMAVVSGALVAAVVATQRNLGVANATMTDMAAARNAIERVGALLRSATSADGVLDVDGEAALISAAADDVTFYSRTGVASADNSVLVRLHVDDQGDLVEERTMPSPLTGGTPTWTGTPSSRVIVRDLQRPEIFTYWSHNQDVEAGEPVSNRCGRILDPGTGTLSGSEMAITDSVSYIIEVRDDSSGYDNRPVELRGWARLANVEGIGYSGDYGTANCLDVIEGGYDYAP